jgi:hypothetical protein
MKRQAIIFSALIILLGLSGHAFGANYWVHGTSGSNANGCNASASPLTTTAKQTIAAGIACLSGGDTLSIRAGTYNEHINCIEFPSVCPPSGAAGAPTRIQGHAGETVELRIPGGTGFGIGIGNRNWLVFDNFIIDGRNMTVYAYQLIRYEGTAANSVFQNLTTRNAKGFHILNASSGGVTFRYMDMRFGPDQAPLVDQNEPFNLPYFIYGCHNLLFEHNRLSHHNEFGDTFAIHCYPSLSDATFRYNHFDDTGPLLFQYNGTNIKFHNNTIRNGKGLISCANYGMQIFNNSFYNTVSGTGGPDDGVAISIRGPSLDCYGDATVVKNNIAVDSAVANYRDLETNTIASNNIFSGSGANHFANAANGDFSLIATSTARNAGTSSIASGVTACGNGTPDIGAHEEITVTSAEVGLIDSTTVDIAIANPCTSDVLPATGITGLTIQEDTGGGFSNKTISSVTSPAGSNRVRAVVTSAFTGGSSARFSYSPGNITDARKIGGTNNQRLNAVSNFTITNNVGGGGGGGATFTVVNARAYDHDCAEVCARVLSSNVTGTGGFSLPIRGKALVRIGLGASGGDPPATAFALWYDKNGGSDIQVPTQATGSEDVSLCPAPAVQNGQATTQQITSGTFAAGQVRTIGTGAPSIDMVNGGRTELVYSICTNVTASDTINLKMKEGGGGAVANTAKLAIDFRNPSRAAINEEEKTALAR